MNPVKLDSASSTRNEAPIKEVLLRVLDGKSGNLLELASGSGQHAARLSPLFPQLTWWPTDIDDQNLASIEAWRDECGGGNLMAAQFLDATLPSWATGALLPGLPAELTAVYCTNMVHISPWEATQGLFAGAAHRVAPDGLIFLYGPYRRDGQHTSEGNTQFDTSLRARNPAWGVRDMEEVEALAESHGFRLEEVVDMPANNFSLVFRR